MDKGKIIKILRLIHRDLGYLMVGISLVYGISGIYLNHMGESDPAFVTVEESVQMPAGLNDKDFSAKWSERGMVEIKRQMPIDSTCRRLMLDGGIGVYNVETGIVDYETHRRKEFVYWINRLHYNKLSGWSIMGDIFAISLIFFAVSGLFMVRGSKGLKGRGKWYLIIGVAIPIIYVLMA